VTLFYKISVNLMSFAFLSIVYYIAKLHLDRNDKFNRLYLNTCRLVLATLLFEALAVILNGHTAIYASYLLKILLAFLFSLTPFLAHYWLLFGKVLTGDDSAKNGMIRPVYTIPVLINFIISILSVFFDLLFTVDENNQYQPGPLYIVILVITYGYFLFAFVLLFRHRHRFITADFKILAFIYLLPVLGGTLQNILPGVFLMWGFTADALIVMYMYLQELLIQTDSLTGASTRRSFVQRLNQVKETCSNRPVGILFLDIDDFKLINDQYGHAEGDMALKTFAKIIKSVLRKRDTLARFGGDEFALLVMVDDEEDLYAVETKIEAALENYNDHPTNRTSSTAVLGRSYVSGRQPSISMSCSKRLTRSCMPVSV